MAERIERVVAIDPGKLTGAALVYALCEPGSTLPCADSVRYIGKARVLKERLHNHVLVSRRQSTVRPTHSQAWIKSLGTLDPTGFVLEVCSSDQDAYEAEVKWIVRYRSLGARLTNHTDGGEGANGLVFSEEAIAKIRDSAIRNAADLEWRRKVSDGTRRGQALMSLEAREQWRRNLAASNSEDVRQAKGWLRGLSRDPDSVEKTAAAHRGAKRSEETRSRISAAKRGKPWSDSMRKAMTEGERYCDVCGDGPFQGGRGVGNHKRRHTKRDDSMC